MSIWDLEWPARPRVIIDTDAKNEADDQFAIVHALLSPSLDVRGLVPAHFGNRFTRASMEASREEIGLLLQLLGMTGRVRVEDGAPHAIPDAVTPVDCPGARLILEEAMRDDPTPLFAAFLGPLTDMASALVMEPGIASRDLTVIWIGGDPYDDLGRAYGPEFNLSNDVTAANVVFASSVKLWQVPMSTYVMMAMSYAELYEQVRPCGDIGEYLVRQLVEFNRAHHRPGRPLELRSLGDSPAVGLMLNPNAGLWTERAAPGFNYDCSYDFSKTYRPVRVYKTIDSRFVLADMCAKLRAFASAHEARPS
jgi:inosine-uridine nucleoside N-ribohydrolase